MKRIKINEIIVVEGKDDVTAVKRVIDAHIIALNGFSGMSSGTIQRLMELSRENDLILLTDPDFAGKKIRQKISEHIPAIRHAFISRKDAIKNENIGVENANDKAIMEALENLISKKKKGEGEYVFTVADLLESNLCSGRNARQRRAVLGDYLKIGYYNSKQLLNALNSFSISKSAFDTAVQKLNSAEQVFTAIETEN